MAAEPCRKAAAVSRSTFPPDSPAHLDAVSSSSTETISKRPSSDCVRSRASSRWCVRLALAGCFLAGPSAALLNAALHWLICSLPCCSFLQPLGHLLLRFVGCPKLVLCFA